MAGMVLTNIKIILHLDNREKLPSIFPSQKNKKKKKDLRENSDILALLSPEQLNKINLTLQIAPVAFYKAGRDHILQETAMNMTANNTAIKTSPMLFYKAAV